MAFKNSRVSGSNGYNYLKIIFHCVFLFSLLSVFFIYGVEDKKNKEFPIDGYIKIEYRGRWTENISPFSSVSSDHDLYEYLNINFGNPSKNKVTASIYGRSSQDLNRTKDVQGYYIFDSITDTYNSWLNFRLYHAYIDVNLLWIFEKVRVGRQFLYDTPEVLYLDGVLAETKPVEKAGNLILGIYGGLPTHLFESSVEGDMIAGMYISCQFLPTNRFTFDWTYIRDQNFLGVNNNNLVGVSFLQNFGESFQLYTQTTMVDSTWRDLMLTGVYTSKKGDFWIRANFKRLNETQKQLTIQFDPYFVIAQELFPYNHYQIDLYKRFSDKFSVGTGMMIRDLEDENQTTRFNREFRRFYITPVYHIRKIPTDMALTLEWWDAAGSQDIKTIGLDITTDWSKKLRTSFGTYYVLYKYDYYVDIERQNVRNYYIKAKYKLKDFINIDGRFELESTWNISIYTFDFGVKYEF